MSESNKPSIARRLIKRMDGARFLGVCLLALALFSTVTSINQSRASARLSQGQAEQAKCIQAYTDGFADALDARTKSSVEAQIALDQLVDAIATTKVASPERAEALNKAVDNYQSVREKQKATQAQNPYPPAPREVCKR